MEGDITATLEVFEDKYGIFVNLNIHKCVKDKIHLINEKLKQYTEVGQIPESNMEFVNFVKCRAKDVKQKTWMTDEKHKLYALQFMIIMFYTLIHIILPLGIDFLFWIAFIVLFMNTMMDWLVD